MMIVIIEDDAGNMMRESSLVRSYCPKERVLQFLDPKVCVRHFDSKNESNPDLIFCDYEMPGLDGLDIYEYFKERGFNGEFYFVTGHFEHSIEIPEGCGYISKPVSERQFRKACDGRKT